MLSLDDARAYEKEQAADREAKRRAQKLLKSWLEDQMRERNIKSNMDNNNVIQRNGIIIDRMKELDIEHYSKVKSILRFCLIFNFRENVIWSQSIELQISTKAESR